MSKIIRSHFGSSHLGYKPCFRSKGDHAGPRMIPTSPLRAGMERHDRRHSMMGPETLVHLSLADIVCLVDHLYQTFFVGRYVQVYVQTYVQAFGLHTRTSCELEWRA